MPEAARSLRVSQLPGTHGSGPTAPAPADQGSLRARLDSSGLTENRSGSLRGAAGVRGFQRSGWNIMGATLPRRLYPDHGPFWAHHNSRKTTDYLRSQSIALELQGTSAPTRSCLTLHSQNKVPATVHPKHAGAIMSFRYTAVEVSACAKIRDAQPETNPGPDNPNSPLHKSSRLSTFRCSPGQAVSSFALNHNITMN